MNSGQVHSLSSLPVLKYAIPAQAGGPRLLAVPMGFNPDGVLTLNLSSSYIAQLRFLAAIPLLIAPPQQRTLLLLTPTGSYAIYP
jgi:hypothetical protein